LIIFNGILQSCLYALYSVFFFSIFARSAAHLNKKFFASLAWTAHGVKIWDCAGTLDYKFLIGAPISATPNVYELLDETLWGNITSCLCDISPWQYEKAECVAREIRRIPVKPIGLTLSEAHHLSQSYDGLCRFFPVDVYQFNISSTKGLLEFLRQCQQIDGFGLAGTRRDNQYSILMSDIAIYWQLSRILHSYSGMTQSVTTYSQCQGSVIPISMPISCYGRSFVQPSWPLPLSLSGQTTPSSLSQNSNNLLLSLVGFFLHIPGSGHLYWLPCEPQRLTSGNTKLILYVLWELIF
jgi:hypothetical protein